MSKLCGKTSQTMKRIKAAFLCSTHALKHTVWVICHCVSSFFVSIFPLPSPTSASLFLFSLGACQAVPMTTVTAGCQQLP